MSQLKFECVTCHAQIESDWLELTISDNGVTIPEELQSKIFDPFFTTKEIGKGTGIGLTIVNNILHQHQAHLLLESQPGCGTRFRLFFPVPDNAEITKPEITSEDKPRPNYKQLNGRILLVDDDALVLNMHREYLEMQGMLPTAINDSQQALDLFVQDPEAFDLIITDQTMPGLTGLEFIKQIRYLRPHIPVFLLSGWSNNVNKHNASTRGVDRFLDKPVNHKQLLQDITDLLTT